MSFAPLILVVLATAAVLLKLRNMQQSRAPLPPGPKPLPIIGNLLDMPKKKLAPALRDLGKKYGDLTYLDMLGQPMVILNTYAAAIALLEARSANTSDRPRSTMGELTGFGWVFSMQGYAQQWRTRRRAFHSFFQPQNAVAKHRPVQVRECRRLLRRLLDTPEDFAKLSHHAFSATAMDIVYGITVSEEDDFYVSIAETAARIAFELMLPGRFLVEILPWLRHLPSWFPGAGFKRAALRWRPMVLRMRDAPYDDSLKTIAQNGARPSMISSLYEAAAGENGEVPSEDNGIIRDATGVAYLTGADTSVFATRAMFLSMAQHPEVQRKAQQELDAVVGLDRLPEFSDRESLPYVNAVVKEVLRWHSVVPLGVAHRSIDEDEYNGYCIPAGTILVPNTWAMSRDPEVYPQPEEFIPDRFLEGGKYSSTARDPERFQFGFGRRICPGRHFASDSLFITTASLLHAFDVDPPLGEDGKPRRVAPEVVFDYFLSFHEPFECRITPRAQQAEKLVRDAGEKNVS